MASRRFALRRLLAIAAALLAPALAACDLSTGPDFPGEAMRFEPPARYAAWWRAVEQCSGRRADFRAVRWYVVDGPIEDTDRHKSYAGYWYAKGNRIVFMARSPESVQPDIVRHEMLHAILGPYEPEAHPMEMFRDRCAGIVVCDGNCFEEPVPEPDEHSPMVGARALELTLWLSSRVVSAETDSGWVSIVVRVRNPYPFPIWVHAPTVRGQGPADLFEYEIDGVGREWVHQAMPRVAFGPHETRAVLFDRQTFGSRAIPPGAHRVRAAVLGDSTAASTLEVR